jgi:glycopeptide antibiotics resistance protein
MKSLSKAVFGLYLLTLLWLVLFKFSYDFSSVLLDHQARSLNLIPFLGSSQGNMHEMIDNFVVFIPLGLLLGINLKKVTFWRKLAFISIFSLAVEILQFIFAIGITDITDVITNTFGGLVGLLVYDLGKRYVDNKKLDLFITVVGMVLLIILILLRVFVFRVKY